MFYRTEVSAQVASALSRALDARDPYTAGHMQKVAELSRLTGIDLELTAHELQGLYLAGVLHDIGKIGIGIEILTKPGKLNAFEVGMIQQHPVIGEGILADVDFAWPVREAVAQHHERLDGSGYPAGLAAEQICLEARVIAVADTVDAMASHRPYRKAQGLKVVMAELEKEAGTRLDADVVSACTRVLHTRDLGYEW